MAENVAELKLTLARVIEALVATHQRLNEISVSVLALRGAVQNCDSTGNFGVQYEKIYKNEVAQLKDRLSSDMTQLLETANQLRME